MGNWTRNERMHACTVLSSLLQDTSCNHAWAPRLEMLRAPARAFRWAATGSVDAPAAYALVRHMVESGGAAVASEVWRLCRRTLETPSALKGALDLQTRASGEAPGASTDENEQWRLLLLTVLRVGADSAEIHTWGEAMETLQLLKTVKSNCGDDTGAQEACAALTSLSAESIQA